MRIALIGDVGGYPGRYMAALEALGVKRSRSGMKIPRDLIIVQVGDVVGRNVNGNSPCVDISHSLISGNRFNFVQLMGNWESHYLITPEIGGAPELSHEDLSKMRLWQATGAAKYAFAFECDKFGEVVVTHGGVTHELWQYLGGLDAHQTARQINEAAEHDDPRIFERGQMIEIGAAQPGPLWASDAELFASWHRVDRDMNIRQREMPFTQIHGHSSPFRWNDNLFRRNVPQELIDVTTLERETRRTTVHLNKPIISIDAGLGPNHSAVAPLPVLMLQGSTLDKPAVLAL